MIKSPCINICKMDELNGQCTGCFRTIDEITVWSRTDDETRTSILASISERREEHLQRASKLITCSAM
jgi:predicted Fe-S protein YdhL (DUF1289 family)